MPYLLFTWYQIMWTLIGLPLQMVERLRRAQPVAVANHVKARQSPIERAVTWLATEFSWAQVNVLPFAVVSFAEASLFSSSAAPVSRSVKCIIVHQSVPQPRSSNSEQSVCYVILVCGRTTWSDYCWVNLTHVCVYVLF